MSIDNKTLANLPADVKEELLAARAELEIAKAEARATKADAEATKAEAEAIMAEAEDRRRPEHLRARSRA